MRFLLSGSTGWGARLATLWAVALPINIQIPNDPISLDPTLSEDGIGLKILDAVHGRLMVENADGKPVPDLAEKVSVSKDGKRYDFTLRAGLKWSDGEPITAEHFVTSIRRALAPATPGKLVDLLNPIRGAREYRGGKLEAEKLGVRADGPRRLTVELESPAPYLLHALTLSFAAPLRADVLQANGGSWPPTGPSTGTYRITSIKRDQEVILERVRSDGPQTVRFRVVRDEATAAHLFDTGELDVLTRVPIYETKRFSDKGVLRRDPFAATYYLGFNTRKAPFNEVARRKAVVRAIDTRGITEALGTGEAPATGWIPLGLEGHRSKRPPTKPESPPNTWPKITASFDTNPRNSWVMEKVQADLKKTLGIELTLQALDWKTYVSSLSTDPTPIYRFAWLAPFSDPILHLLVFTTGNANNPTGWGDPRYDQLVAEIAALAPGKKRLNLIEKAQEILLERDAVIAPLFHYVQVHAVAPRVQGFTVTRFGTIRLEAIRLK